MAKSAVESYAVEDRELDLRSLGAALWQRKLWIIVPTLVVAIGSAVVVNMMTPRYKSEARIVYDGRENVFLRPDAEKSINQDRGPADAETLTDQVQIVLSRELALGVIADLKLNELPEFDPVLRGQSVLRHLLSRVGLSRDLLAMSPEERVLESWYDRLTAYSVDKSRVIVIEFQSSDPMLAARITNAVAADYLRRQQLVRQEQTRGAGQWLANEIEGLRPKVAEAEAKAEAFRGDTNLMVGTNNTTLSNQQLGEFNSQFAGALGQKADAETRARIIREMLRQGGPIEASDVVNSELIRRLSEQRVLLRSQLAEQSATLLDGHPRIKELKAQIADLDRQIRAEAEKIARTFDNDARIATARLDAMTSNLNALKRQAATANEKDVEYRALEREAKAQRDLLESYLAKYRETTARETIGNAPPDAKIISPAIVSNTPAFPRKVPIIAVSTLLALVLSCGLVTTRELMRAVAAPMGTGRPAFAARIRVESDIESESYPSAEPRTDLQSILPADAVARPDPLRESADAVAHETAVGGARPIRDGVTGAAEHVAFSAPAAVYEMDTITATGAPPVQPDGDGPPSPADTANGGDAPMSYPTLGLSMAAIRDIARRLHENADIAPGIVVLGSRPDIATTLPTLMLARALAADAKVIVVGLCEQAPVLDAIAEPRAMPGLADVVRGAASFGQIIAKDKLSRVHVVRRGRSRIATEALLASRSFAVMMQALSRAYRNVVIDAGTLSADCFLLAAVAPRAMLVAADNAQQETAAAEEMLRGAGFADIAVINGAFAGVSPGLAAA